MGWTGRSTCPTRLEAKGRDGSQDAGEKNNSPNGRPHQRSVLGRMTV